MEEGRTEVIITTQKKCSIMFAIGESQPVFSLVISAAKLNDADFYLKVVESVV